MLHNATMTPDLELISSSIVRPYGTTQSRQNLIQSILGRGFPYSRFVSSCFYVNKRLTWPYRKLSRHSSCVNTITFSNDGRWLASAGDGAWYHFSGRNHAEPIAPDPYIFLWDFHQDNLTGPSHSFRGPRVSIVRLFLLPKC